MLNKKIAYSLAVFVLVGVVSFGCSSTPVMFTPKALSTQVINEQYYYCESCDKPTELMYQEDYQLLEPEITPTPVIKPIITSQIIKPRHNVSKTKHKAHKNPALKQHKPKQCI